MFDASYPFRYIMSEHEEGELYQLVHKFTFRGPRNQLYIVIVEQYPLDVFALKFHLKCHSRSPNKYQLLTV